MVLPNICKGNAPFSNLSNKGSSISPHPSSQTTPSKKIDKHTKKILKKVGRIYINKLFDHTENAISCGYFDINH